MRTRYNFDKETNRKATHSYKWNIPDNGASVTVADTDFEVASEIQQAIVNRAKQSTYGYTYVPDEYYEAYIRWWRDRYQTDLKKGWFIFSTSIVASVDTIIKRLTEVGEKVCLFSPNYNVFYNCISNNKRVAEEVNLTYQNHEYSIDWEKLEESLSKSKLFIHCNPHNPIGKQYSIEENEKIISLCKKYNVYLLSDEIHSDLDYNEKRYNPIIKTKEYERLILALSPGKSFNLAGLHSSVLVIPNEELRSRIEKGLQEDDVGEPSYFSIEPVIAAYTKGDEYVQEENAYIYENKRYLKEFFIKNGLNLEIIGGNATYLLWIDISHYSNDSVAFVNDFSNKYNLFLIDGKHYHESQSSFVRINIATQKKNIIHLCNCLLDYLK